MTSKGLHFVFLLIKMSLTAGRLDPPVSLILASQLPNYQVQWLQNQLFVTTTEESLTLGNTEVIGVTGRGQSQASSDQKYM